MAVRILPRMKALGHKRALLEGCSILDTHRHCPPFVVLPCPPYWSPRKAKSPGCSVRYLGWQGRQQNLTRCHLTEGMAACFLPGRRSCRGCKGCRSCRSHRSYRRMERHLRHLTRHSTESAEQAECCPICSLAGIPLAGVAQPPGWPEQQPAAEPSSWTGSSSSGQQRFEEKF